jgi:hypothetical protein
VNPGVQAVFPGMECFVPEPKPKKQTTWKPKPGTLARVKVYFEGYAANGRDIYARRKHIAERLGIGIRTLARYLAHLAAIGWIETAWRTARTAFRKVLAFVSSSSSSGPSSGPPIEAKTPRTKVLERREVISPLVIWLYPSNQAKDSKPLERTGIPNNLPFEVWRGLRQKLRNAAEWIEKAKNPVAYENAIIKRELERAGVAQ